MPETPRPSWLCGRFPSDQVPCELGYDAARIRALRSAQVIEVPDGI